MNNKNSLLLLTINRILNKPNKSNPFTSIIYNININRSSNNIRNRYLLNYFCTTTIYENSQNQPNDDKINNNIIKKKKKIEIILNEKDLIESFIKGSGNGGQ